MRSPDPVLALVGTYYGEAFRSLYFRVLEKNGLDGTEIPQRITMPALADPKKTRIAKSFRQWLGGSEK